MISRDVFAIALRIRWLLRYSAACPKAVLIEVSPTPPPPDFPLFLLNKNGGKQGKTGNISEFGHFNKRAKYQERLAFTYEYLEKNG